MAFREAAQPIRLKVFATELDPLAPTCFIADGAFQVPRLSDPASPGPADDLCRGFGVGLIVPTIDTELPILAARRRISGRRHPCRWSPPLISSICAGTNGTLILALREAGCDVPPSWLPEIPPPDRLPEHLFLKPRDGSSSINAYPCTGRPHRMLSLVPNAIVQECLQGQEVTMDAFLDFQGPPIHFVPRERIRTLGASRSRA